MAYSKAAEAMTQIVISLSRDWRKFDHLAKTEFELKDQPHIQPCRWGKMHRAQSLGTIIPTLILLIEYRI